MMVVMFSRILSPVTLVDIVTVNTADCKLEIGRQRRRERVSEFTPYSPIFSHPYVDFYLFGVFFLLFVWTGRMYGAPQGIFIRLQCVFIRKKIRESKS